MQILHPLESHDKGDACTSDCNKYSGQTNNNGDKQRAVALLTSQVCLLASGVQREKWLGIKDPMCQW